MNFVRWILGRLVLAYAFLTRPKPVTRDAAEQQRLDTQTARYALYQFNACPFCVKVRQQMRKYALNIELRDARNDPAHKAELIREGGDFQVPCLRIENGDGAPTWLYESDEIIAYLKRELKLA